MSPLRVLIAYDDVTEWFRPFEAHPIEVINVKGRFSHVFIESLR